MRGCSGVTVPLFAAFPGSSGRGLALDRGRRFRRGRCVPRLDSPLMTGDIHWSPQPLYIGTRQSLLKTKTNHHSRTLQASSENFTLCWVEDVGDSRKREDKQHWVTDSDSSIQESVVSPFHVQCGIHVTRENHMKIKRSGVYTLLWLTYLLTPPPLVWEWSIRLSGDWQ